MTPTEHQRRLEEEVTRLCEDVRTDLWRRYEPRFQDYVRLVAAHERLSLTGGGTLPLGHGGYRTLELWLQAVLNGLGRPGGSAAR